MNPLNAKKLSYLRAQTFILRPTGLSVEEIAKKTGKIRTLGTKMIVEK